MSLYVSGVQKVDVAMAAASSAFTTPYYDMAGYNKAIFIVTAGTMGSSENIALTINQAVSSTGSGAVALGAYTTIGSTTALACNAKKASVLYYEQSDTGVDGATLVLNGVTFTHKTTSVLGSTSGASTGDFSSNRYIATSSANITAVHQNHLAAYINHATYGCTGLLAVAGSTFLTIYANPPGEKVITAVASVSSAIGMRPLQSIGIVECDSAELSVTSSMRYVGLVATPSVAANVNKMSALLVRSGARFSPDTTNLVGAAGRST